MEFVGVIVCILVAIALSVPLGQYISRIMNGEEVFLSKIISPVEMSVYECLRVDREKQMKCKEYAISVLGLSGIGFLVLFLILLCQGVPVLNPQNVKGLRWDLAFNTAVSFVTNTDWQVYSNEFELSYLSQAFGLTVQNFISPAVGMAVLFAFIRGFSNEKDGKMGNFWVDVTRAILYVFIPLSLILSIFLVSQGVIQNFNSYVQVPLLENIFPGNGVNITSQIIPQGPVATQVAIKQLGTNGGGFFKANSAHPFENPTSISNILEMISMVIIPMSLCFAFGETVKNKKQGIAIFCSMLFLLLVSIFTINLCEKNATPQLVQNGEVDVSSDNQSGGNMEGKESRIGSVYSGTWTALATATSNGSMNSRICSYTPLSGLVAMFQMQTGEVIFGGIGSGLYRMLAFIIITVFIIGLLIGKTPEYLGKRIEPFEMKMAMIICLVPSIMTITGSIIACVLPDTIKNLTNMGPHGFSEVFYNFLSVGTNNGSAFGGFKANTLILNLITGVIMAISRFVPMTAVLAVADSLGRKQKLSANGETLKIDNVFFSVMLVIVVIFIGFSIFLPSLVLGPVTEFLQMFY